MPSATDPRRVLESKDMEGAVLYAKQISNDAADAWPVLADASGYLLVNLTVGTVTVSSTASTITNAVGNPVNVSLTATKVTIESASGLNVNVATATLGTVTISGNVNVATATLGTVTVALSPTVVTVQNSAAGFNVNIATATLGTVTVSLSSTKVTVDNTVTTSLSSTKVTIEAASGVTVSLSSTKVTIDNNVTLSSTAVSISTAVTYSTLMLTSKTLTTASGTLSATNGTITFTPTNRAKVYAISLTTTSATELICIFNSGGVANGIELWRATLMAPAGANSGLNLAVTPPNFLFASRSGTAVSLSLNTATLIHYSVSYFDEA